MTSTYGLQRQKQKSFKVQVNFKSPKKLKGHVKTQFPIPKKKKKSLLSSTFQSNFTDDEGSVDNEDVDSDESDTVSSESSADDICKSKVKDTAVGTCDDFCGNVDNLSSIVVDSGGGINSYSISNIIDDNYGGECVNSIIVNKECVNSELNVNFVENEYVNENESSGDSDWKDTVTDDDYIPSEEPMSSDEYDSDIEDLSFKLRNERTLFVYQLLRFCPKCGGPLDQSMIEEVKNTGSQLHLKITCFNMHC